jgi:TRAP-type mannitol/chloroaromatic compound transport system substrate-binding protein
LSKKTLLLFAALGLVLALVAGCTQPAAPAGGGEGTTPPSQQEEEETPSQQADTVYQAVWQDIDPAGQAQWFAIQNTCERVKLASNGRLVITPHPEGEIVPRNDVTPGVAEGVVDMITVNPAMDQGRIGPATYMLTASGLPAGPSTIECLAWLYQGGGIDIINDAYKDYAVCVGASAGAAELFCHSKKPLSTAADFQGLKFRTMGMWAEVLAQYGAVVTTVAGGELYSSVERGVLDAFEFGPPSTNWVYGFHEICPYIGLPGIQSPGYTKPVLVNKEFFGDLPSDLQEILKHECMAFSLDSYNLVSYDDALAMDLYKAYGTKIFYVEDDFQKDIAARTRALCEKYASEDALFQTAWDSQNTFFSVWRSLTGIVPKYTIYD